MTLSVDLATGRVRITGGPDTLEAKALGIVQTASKWASVTGRLRVSAHGMEPAFVLIIDDTDGSATLQVDDRPNRVYKLRP